MVGNRNSHELLVDIIIALFVWHNICGHLLHCVYTDDLASGHQVFLCCNYTLWGEGTRHMCDMMVTSLCHRGNHRLVSHPGTFVLIICGMLSKSTSKSNICTCWYNTGVRWAKRLLVCTISCVHISIYIYNLYKFQKGRQFTLFLFIHFKIKLKS